MSKGLDQMHEAGARAVGLLGVLLDCNLLPSPHAERAAQLCEQWSAGFAASYQPSEEKAA